MRWQFVAVDVPTRLARTDWQGTNHIYASEYYDRTSKQNMRRASLTQRESTWLKTSDLTKNRGQNAGSRTNQGKPNTLIEYRSRMSDQSWVADVKAVKPLHSVLH
jgi:hypothetical protein